MSFPTLEMSRPVPLNVSQPPNTHNPAKKNPSKIPRAQSFIFRCSFLRSKDRRGQLSKVLDCMSKELYRFLAREMNTRRPSDPLRPGQQQDYLDFEINFFEALVAESPDFLDALIPLAQAYTRKGLHKKGLAVDEKIVCLRPKDPVSHYNLACSYALLGKIPEALSSLEKALVLGYSDMAHLRKDADLENLRKDPRFRALLARFAGPKADPPSADKTFSQT